MPGFGDLATFLRRKRQAKGFDSARSLALRAGLGHSHVAMFERGEFRPRWKTAARLMKALQLSPEEREEFSRLWTAAGTPAAARAATAGIALPGLVLWRHLPELLYACRSRLAPFPQGFLDDEVLFQGVRCAAATLAWVALVTDPPGPQQRAALAGEFRAYAEKSRTRRPQTGARPAILNHLDTRLEDSLFLAHVWRRTLFRERRAASRWVRLLKEWDCFQAGLVSWTSAVYFKFRDADLDRRYGLFSANTDIVCRCHDALVSMQLATDLGLVKDHKALVDRLDPAWPDLDLAAQYIEKVTADDYRRELNTSADELREPTIEDATSRAAFALRLFDIPALAARVFGSGDQATATRFRLKVAELQAVYDAERLRP